MDLGRGTRKSCCRLLSGCTQQMLQGTWGGRACYCYCGAQNTATLGNHSKSSWWRKKQLRKKGSRTSHPGRPWNAHYLVQKTEGTVRIQCTAAIGKVLRSISIESNVGEWLRGKTLRPSLEEWRRTKLVNYRELWFCVFLRRKYTEGKIRVLE